RRAAKVQHECVIPVLIRRCQKCLGWGSARIRNANIDPAKDPAGIANELFDGLRVVYIYRRIVDLHAEPLADLACRLLQSLRVTSAKRQVYSLGCQRERRRPPQTLARSRHYRYAIPQTCIHLKLRAGFPRYSKSSSKT